MIPDVNRQRIEKYLNAHEVNFSESDLMKITQTLIDDTEEEAQYFLKQLILHYRDVGVLDVEKVCINQHFEYLNSLPKVNRQKESKLQLAVLYGFTGFLVICAITFFVRLIW